MLEVGLGGRLDSTNIIHPELSVITNIGWDHMDMLGNTLPLIATEKAGIIKPRSATVIGESRPELVSIFREAGGSSLLAVDDDFEATAHHGPCARRRPTRRRRPRR